MPNFDPWQELPPGQEPTVISKPIVPAQGFAYDARPSDPDPMQTSAAAAAAAARNHAALAAWNAQHPGLAGAGKAVPPAAPLYDAAAPPPAPGPPAAPPAAEPALPAAPAPEAAPAAAPRGGGGGAGGGSPGAIDAATGEAKAAGQEQTATAQGAVAIAGEKAGVDAAADLKRADEAKNAVTREHEQRAAGAAAMAEAKANFAEKQAQVDNFKFHDFFSDMSAPRQILAGIGMLLGGASYDANHVNQSVGVINSAMERDSKRQLDYLHSKEHLAELAHQGVQDTQSYLAHEMENFHTAEALKHEAVARQIDTLSSTARGKLNINAAQQAAADQRARAAKAQQDALLQGTHNRLMLSEIALNRAKAANEGVAKTQKVTSAAEKAANDLVEKKFKSDAGLTADLKVRDEIKGAKELIVPDKDGLVNGVNFQQAIDKTVRAATGLGARPQAIAMFQSSLGGVWNKVQRAIQKGETGQYTKHDVAVLKDALDKQERNTQLVLDVRKKRHTEEFARNPTTKGHKDIYEGAINTRFGSPDEAATAAPAADPNAEARAWATANPKDPRAAKIMERIGAR